MSRFGIFNLNGNDYDLDDLTINEGEELENLCDGVAFNELNYGSMKVMKRISFVLQKRKKPDITLEEAGEVKIISFAPPDEEMPALPPDQDDEVSPNGSEPEDSGVPASVVSITG